MCIHALCCHVAGSLPDSSVFSTTEFGQVVENGTLNAPPPSPLPGTDIMMPYFLVGDEIFPLRHNLMRPYSRRNRLTETERIYDYRHSQPRRVIENVFGILTTRYNRENRYITSISSKRSISFNICIFILSNVSFGLQ